MDKLSYNLGVKMAEYSWYHRLTDPRRVAAAWQRKKTAPKKVEKTKSTGTGTGLLGTLRNRNQQLVEAQNLRNR